MGIFGQQGELPIPPRAKADAKAIELVRIWAAGGEQQLALRAEAWPDAAAWGILLVDLARHAAQAFAQTHACKPEEALRRIREGFDAEWSAPTDNTGNE